MTEMPWWSRSGPDYSGEPEHELARPVEARSSGGPCNCGCADADPAEDPDGWAPRMRRYAEALGVLAVVHRRGQP